MQEEILLKEQNKLHSQKAGRCTIEMNKICHVYRFQKERLFERKRYATFTEYRMTVFERTRYSTLI
jgi:hypothetical protein